VTAGTLRPLASASSRQARARALRERIDAEPGGTLEAPRDELLELLGPPPGENGDEPDPARYAQSLLAQHGIRPTPPLTEPAESVRLAPTPSYAIQGAIAVALLTVIVGALGYWLYGVLFVLAGAVSVAVVAWRYDALRRHLPPAVPSGRMLGALVAGAVAIAVGIVAVLPIRHHRSQEGRARGLVVQADRAVDKGDFTTAKDKLAAAEQLDAQPPNIDDVRAHLVVAQVAVLLERQARGQATTDQRLQAAIAALRRAARGR